MAQGNPPPAPDLVAAFIASWIAQLGVAFGLLIGIVLLFKALIKRLFGNGNGNGQNKSRDDRAIANLEAAVAAMYKVVEAATMIIDMKEKTEPPTRLREDDNDG